MSLTSYEPRDIFGERERWLGENRGRRSDGYYSSQRSEEAGKENYFNE